MPDLTGIFWGRSVNLSIFGGLALAPRHTKEVAYKTLVRPQLEYAAPIWHPYNETETKKGGESAEDSSQVDLQAMA